jgi:hypothetical protein
VQQSPLPPAPAPAPALYLLLLLLRYLRDCVVSCDSEWWVQHSPLPPAPQPFLSAPPLTNDIVLPRLAILPFTRLFSGEGSLEYTGCGSREHRG